MIHFFLEILHFKESCNLTDQKHLGPKLKNQNFAKYGISGEISMTILVFILDYLQEKLMTIFFKKSKKPVLGPFWALFPKFGQK